jgi:hypothetical protein
VEGDADSATILAVLLQIQTQVLQRLADRLAARQTQTQAQAQDQDQDQDQDHIRAGDARLGAVTVEGSLHIARIAALKPRRPEATPPDARCR